ncbi:kinase-like protein [Atractiella rhizophila]|nr:kinase-like protein [Atractiella rhizophila]
MPLTTTQELETYLASKGIRYKLVEVLTGGAGNFVWRITLPSGEERVVKHHEPYVKNSPSIPFSVDRMEFEADALSNVSHIVDTIQLTGDAPVVLVPTLHYSDLEAHVLIMDYAGPSNLKAWYPSATATLVPSIGSTLGVWLAQLHHRTLNTKSRDNVTARGIYRYAYSNLSLAFEKHGLDVRFAKSIDAEFGSKLATDDVCQCHGDFWPGNVLVQEENGSMKLSIVDWEMTRRGIGSTDVAQFAAEAYLLDRFCGGKGLLKAFLEAYVEAARKNGQIGGREEKEEFVKRAIVHFGVHIAFWPVGVKWCEEEETKELGLFAKGFMEAGRSVNWAKIEEGPLSPLLGLLE